MHEILIGSRSGDSALAEIFQDLWIDGGNAIYSVVQHIAANYDRAEIDLLTELVRTYRWRDGRNHR